MTLNYIRASVTTSNYPIKSCSQKHVPDDASSKKLYTQTSEMTLKNEFQTYVPFRTLAELT